MTTSQTKFILDEYENLDPSTEEVTTDQVIGSFGTDVFDFEKGKILYNEEKVDEIFDLFRMIQTGPNKQVRYEHPGIPKNITFNLSPKNIKKNFVNNLKHKIGRNERVNVVYQNGTRKDNIKYKTVEDDVENGKCRVVKY